MLKSPLGICAYDMLIGSLLSLPQIVRSVTSGATVTAFFTITYCGNHIHSRASRSRTTGRDLGIT